MYTGHSTMCLNFPQRVTEIGLNLSVYLSVCLFIYLCLADFTDHSLNYIHVVICLMCL